MSLRDTISKTIERAVERHHAGAFEEAEALYREALTHLPYNHQLLTTLALVLQSQERFNEAASVIQEAITYGADTAVAYICLGELMLRVGEPERAEKTFRQALGLEPEYLRASVGLCTAVAAQAKFDEADRLIVDISVAPDTSAKVLYDLAIALDDLDQRDQALQAAQRAVALDPGHFQALFLLATLNAETGNAEGALAYYRRALETSSPEAAPTIHSALLMAMHYAPSLTRDEIFEEHCRWGDRYARPDPGPMPIKLPDPNRCLNVGFVSKNFRHYATAHFLLSVLKQRPRNEWKAVLYSGVATPDSYTQTFQNTADVWRDVWDLADDDLAAQIRADDIDVLFDLDGHTRGNRLTVFARRVAPVQTMWLDYIDTTGVPTMDYLVGDPIQTPFNEQPWYRETVVQMPRDHICFQPPDYAPDVEMLPARNNGFVTFGCFNNLVKVTPQVISVWARIMQKIPSSRLILNTPELRHVQTHTRYYDSLYLTHGIDRSRLGIFIGGPHKEFMAQYNEIDIALDTFPYSGGLTTCEALWMGVPVVTFPGNRFCGRHATAHLTTAGLEEFIAEDVDSYVDRAVELATDLDRLEGLRRSLRTKVANSSLVDTARFTRDFSDLIRNLWRRACKGVSIDTAGQRQ